MENEHPRRVYTRSGDDGYTVLADGRRVAKTDARVEASGALDELNAVLGLAIASNLAERIASIVNRLQNELFLVGSEVALPGAAGEQLGVSGIESRHVTVLEEDIDNAQEAVPPVEEFLLRGGSAGAASLHLACTVCRRAERRVVALSEADAVRPITLQYLNRLGDLLFVLARLENYLEGVVEPLWNPEV